MNEFPNYHQLEELPSYEFYQKLINDHNLNDVNNFCSDGLNTYAKDEWLHKLCRQLIKIVELVPDNDSFHKTLFRDNFLEYLTQVKNFFDYIENYNFIKDEIKKSIYYECQTYFDYLKERIPLFFSFEALCKDLDSNSCTDYIQDYLLYDPRNVFTKYELLKLYLQASLYPCYNKVIHVFNEFKKSNTEFIARYNHYVEAFSNKPAQQGVMLAQIDEVKHAYTVENPKGPTVTVVIDSEQLPEIRSELHSGDGISSSSMNEHRFPLIKIAFSTILSVLLVSMLIRALWKVKTKTLLTVIDIFNKYHITASFYILLNFILFYLISR
ncbi:hypothetical protein C922_05354 [Plasmodium inui San Antonio 1]|uniref:Variable surface protein n=1 Tax=Plasmodium inui San Antonio 1 TaxID=1237626 RepID=W6ZTN4_9APIC|nr:hypothetical protein C922_05354 [Plasmodium inui San Antonio 1]EUD64267.1 hypothetical protein C922_05354 [Plasmodium inui San Antonio 1]